MRTRNRVGLLGGLAAAGLAGAVGMAGAADERPTINWATSWEAAVEEATARNVPIFVTFHKDG
ncbi:MAG: hypothetical protein KIT58_20245 [Planctomycetota bacterium]|nr:hypothetical protein [Planctomycetota bacterium]